MKKFKMICRACGSENVLRDAFASWDYDNQRWALHNAFDHAICEDCEGPTSIDEIETEENHNA
jgi:hypothetical protein